MTAALKSGWQVRTNSRLMQSPANTGSAGGTVMAQALQSTYSVSGSALKLPWVSTSRVGSTDCTRPRRTMSVTRRSCASSGLETTAQR